MSKTISTRYCQRFLAQLVLALLAISASALLPFCQDTWVRLYSAVDADLGSALATSVDGKSFVAGQSGNSEWSLVVVNALGGIDRQAKYTATNPDSWLDDIQLLPDGGLLAIGRSYLTPFFLTLARLDGNSDVVWAEQLTRAHDLGPDASVAVGKSGNIMLVASCGAPRGHDMAVLLLAQQGKVKWAKRFRGHFLPGGRNAIASSLPNGDYVIGASGIADTGPGEIGFLFFINSKGKVLSAKAYSLPFDALLASADGSHLYAVADILEPYPSYHDALILAKINASGDILWQRVVRDDTTDLFCSSLAILEDGGVLIAGYRNDYGDIRDSWLLDISAEGRPIWQKNYARVKLMRAVPTDNLQFSGLGEEINHQGAIAMRLDASGLTNQGCDLITDGTLTVEGSTSLTSQTPTVHVESLNISKSKYHLEKGAESCSTTDLCP